MFGGETGARVEHDDVCFAAREQLIEDGQVANYDCENARLVPAP